MFVDSVTYAGFFFRSGNCAYTHFNIIIITYELWLRIFCTYGVNNNTII